MLSIAAVSYQYKHANESALIHVDLDIAPGEVFGLLGPNGAGKTTLISLICGTLPLQQGAISIDGVEEAGWRSKLSIVPQEYAFYPMLTVQENLNFFTHVQGLKGNSAKASIANAIAVTGLELSLKKVAGHCSGGIRRRLNLAIGLLNDPDYLLLDEPTVGVDPQSRAFILETIKQLAEGGKTIIYTSHYMEEVELLCKNVAIMDRGCILLAGQLESLLEQHQTMATVRLALDQLTVIQRTALEEGFPSIDLNNNLQILDGVSESSLTQLLQLCVEQQIKVEQVRYGYQNLEELFLSLTKRSLRE